jgi:hypothetical protein
MALLLLGLAACGSEPGRDDGANTAVADRPAAPANAAAGQAAARPAPAPLVLDDAGLRISGASPARTVTFDTPEAATIEAVTAALGAPPSERGANAECGGGGGLQFAEWKDRITLWFEAGRFAGWDSHGDLRTAGGVRIGSSRAEVAALPGVEVAESTLGTEFTAGRLGGLLDSSSADARVTDLWGGATCQFR